MRTKILGAVAVLAVLFTGAVCFRVITGKCPLECLAGCAANPNP